MVMLVSGEPLAAKPARIVAGHEPERTNELLQAIARCCLSKVRLHTHTPHHTTHTWGYTHTHTLMMELMIVLTSEGYCLWLGTF